MRFAYFTAFSLSTAILPAFAEPSSIQDATQQAVDTRQQQQQNILNAEIQSQQVKAPAVRLESEKVHILGFPKNEEPCFPIHQLVLTDYQHTVSESASFSPSSFSWAKVQSILRAILHYRPVLVLKELTCYYAGFKII